FQPRGGGQSCRGPLVRLPGWPQVGPGLGEPGDLSCSRVLSYVWFFLRKAGHPNPRVQTVPDGTVAEFPIPSVSREDGGSYTCEYHSTTDRNHWSNLSDPVEIIVAGEGPGSQPHTQPDPRGLCTDGTLRARLCPETWAHQRGRLAGERGCGVSGRFPSQGGETAAGDLCQKKGGSLSPGGAAEQGEPFPDNTSIMG
uniref:Ig-like domain-containing protein n=1 Tax=Chelydra serpentina TaxID=8475 RepID=A0A8C3SJ86_CHESE